MASIPTSFNPSDYQFLLKSVSEGNSVTKAQSLKRFNTLVTTDKKQFSIYAKRVVLAIQQMLLQPKEDINLLACTLALDIINLNPREIQYYIRTKLLKNLIKNLGDAKPQIRKTSHYCLLAYVKTYKSFDELISVYTSYGLNSNQWQLKQKSINSFQSILIMEMKYLNWGSGEFRKIFELLLFKLKDDNQYVQKAAEQCLLSLCKIDQIRNFSKKLQNSSFLILKEFCETQKDIGNLLQIKLDIEKPAISRNSSSVHNNYIENHKTLTNAGQSLLTFQKVKQQPQKQSMINRIEEIRRNSQTPKIDHDTNRSLKKVQSVSLVPHKKQNREQYKQPKKQAQKMRQQSSIKLLPQQSQMLSPKKSIVREHIVQIKTSTINNQKTEKVQTHVGRRLIDDLRNQKDWKIRLEAVEQVQSKFQLHIDPNELQSLSKTFLPTLIKLLGDSNFKIALISLKIIQKILSLPATNMPALVPQLVDKLSDNKIALRQNVSKLIRSQYSRTKQNIWIDNLISQIKKNQNSNIKEQILGILARMYEDDILTTYPYNDVLDVISPFMQDMKTKIKIKTLDLLVLISMKNREEIQDIKNLLGARINQVYFEMYCEKIQKELKVNLVIQKPEKNQRSTTNAGSRRYTKNSGNTTSTSLPKYNAAHHDQKIQTIRNSSFLGHQNQAKKIASNQQRATSQIDLVSNARESQDLKSTPRKKPILKSFRKKVTKTFDYKSTTYSNSNANDYLPPFTDPQKELKSILGELQSEDWQASYEALTKLRRIIENHSYLLTHSTVRILIPQIMKLVENLRSSLSKNAVIALNEMSNKVKKLLDTELDLIFSKLIKKTLDANSFISEEVKKSLVSVCSNSNEGRITNLLIGAHTSRALPIKIVIVYILQTVTFLPKFYDKQLEKIVSILVDFMGQGSLEIRQKTKAILNAILASQKGPSIIKLIPQQHLNKLKKRQQIVSVSVINQISNEIKQPHEQSPRKHKNKKITSFPQQFSQLDGLLEKCESSDWKTRQLNMKEIYKIVEKFPEEIFQYRLSGKIIDVLSQQICDPNAKVATNALRIFIQLVKIIPTLIEYNLSVVINSICNCFASNKPEIRLLTDELFETICNNTEKWMLLQHLCNAALYGIQRSKQIVIQKLSLLVSDIYKKKPNIFQKNVYNMINKLVEENKPQFMNQLIEFMKVCFEQIGPDMLNYLKPKSRQLLAEHV